MSLDIKFHHGGISVPDLEASIEWFGRVLDFEVEERLDIDAIPAKVAMLRRGDLRVELFEVPGAKPLPDERRNANTDVQTHGNKHIAFAVRNADETADMLRKRGADLELVGHTHFGDFVFIRDNAGNLIEFVQEPQRWGED